MASKIARGLSSAALDFLVVGVALPFALDYLAGPISAYVTLPPSSSRWAAFLLLGAALAATAFFRSAYSKGDFPWLFGRRGGAVVALALFYYLFLLLPSSIGSAAGVSESSGLVTLLGLAVALSYGYLLLDFVDARRSRRPDLTTNMLGSSD